jgi:excisionase family DNA binding protein
MTSASSRMPRLVTIKAAAQQLCVSTKSIRRWIKRGDLCAHRVGRQWRIFEDDLLRFVQSNRR